MFSCSEKKRPAYFTSHRLNLTQGWNEVSSNIRGFMNDIERSGMPDSLTTQSIWNKKVEATYSGKGKDLILPAILGVI
jgi:hypothetical protein